MRRWAQIAVLWGAFGCGEDEPTCATFEASCTPLYSPTFDQVYNRTLKPSCAQAGGACHAPDGNAGGVTFGDVEQSYQALVAGGRVTPGDPTCSVLSKRLHSTDATFQMPPGQRLSAEARCSIGQWIAAGAPR